MKKVYFLATLILATTALFAQPKEAKPSKVKPVPIDLTRFVLVEGGSYAMGSATGIEQHEKPEHKVTVGSFYIAKNEVTFDEYDRYCDSMKLSKPDDMKWGRGPRPAVIVSWYDAIGYCNWLSRQHRLESCYAIHDKDVTWIDTANGYRLPTEAEWEYAARGGNLSKKTIYAGAEKPDAVAWYMVNSNQQTQPVGQKNPNELGLYDMNGNVWEWVWDLYDGYYYQYSPTDNPKGPATGGYRVMRGGAWYNNANYITVTSRQYNSPDFRQNSVGFRIVRNKK